MQRRGLILVQGIYIAGTILLSFPWAYDQYSVGF
jgi:hypothetical protein